MSRSDWSVVAALIGCLALAWAALSQSQNPQHNRYQSYRYASEKPHEIDPSSALTRSERFEYREPCEQPKGRDESDLCAQWRAAKAGEQSAFWAKWSFWVGVCGLFGLLASLHFTRKAVNAAVNATADADKALKIAERNASGAIRAAVAANESNNIAREVMQTQLRPYVYVDTIIGDFSDLYMWMADEVGDRADFTITIKNYGQAPAKTVRLIAHAVPGKYWSDRPTADLEGIVPVHFADMPNVTDRKMIYRALGLRSVHSDIIDGTASIFIEGKIQYSDAFGNEYFTNFQRALSGKNLSEQQPIITPHWNQAT